VKVLLLTLYHPELVRGGAQQIGYDLFEGLKGADGVDPTLLAAVDSASPALYKSGARITGFDGRPSEFVFLTQRYDHFWHRLRGDDMAEAFEGFLREVSPEVVHFHHFMLFGLDLITLARRVLPEARIIVTFHEFLSLCLAHGQMVRVVDGSICDRATPIRCHQCFPDSSPESFFMRKLWVRRHLDSADLFTVPSRFMIDVYERWGMDRARLAHVPNGQGEGRLTPIAEPPRASRNRFGFFGQLVDNKGVWVILEAVELLRAQGFTDFVVEFNGDNLRHASAARRKQYEGFLQRERALPFADRIVAHNGAYDAGQLAARMGRIDWCLVPSVWPEAFGLVASEAWLHGRPVIASAVGGLAERVKDGENGLLVPPGDARALADAIRRACAEEGLWDRLVAGIRPPVDRETMVAGFLDLYRGLSSR
jgi:glycosyltransferase involved in cell wall biosynthesis